MKFKKIFIYLLFGCLSFQTYAQATDVNKDTTALNDTLKKMNVRFRSHSLLSVGIINSKNSIVDNGISIGYSVLYHSTKQKKQYLQFGIGYDYQHYALNTDNVLYAGKDSLWYNNSGLKLKSNSLNLYYISLPIVYKNRMLSNITFEAGLNNKILVYQENLYRQNTPYSSIKTENFYQNSKFNKYQADVFIRVQFNKTIFVEAKQSLTPVSGYSNFNARPFSLSVGIKL